jgi:hypothetical protein
MSCNRHAFEPRANFEAGEHVEQREGLAPARVSNFRRDTSEAEQENALLRAELIVQVG